VTPPEIDLKKLLRALQARAMAILQACDSRRTRPALGRQDCRRFSTDMRQRPISVCCQELERAGQMVGKEGKTRSRVERASHGCLGRDGISVNTLIDDLLWPTAK
jgi:hypothetical protein